MELTTNPPGNFGWADLATTDSDATKKFYTEILGWTYNDIPMGDGQAYSMCLVNGKEVGALHGMTNGQPPHWNTYVVVESADASAAKAKELGGNILMEPFDVFDQVRLAVIMDPTGAVFSIMQPMKHQGFQLAMESGAVGWNELNTREVTKAGEFYSGLFGWTLKKSDEGPMKYTEFQNAGKSIGGMMEIQPEWGPDVPPHWLIYFNVKDVDTAVSKTTDMGGKALVPPMDIPGVGRFSVVMDPQGAVLAYFKGSM